MQQTIERPTTFKSPGDECESCRKFWEYQNLPPRKLIMLRDSGGHVVTTGTRGRLATYDDEGTLIMSVDPEWDGDREIPVVVCLHCDGDAVLRLSK